MVPNQQWEGVAVAAILGRAGVQPAARFLQVYAADFTVLVPLEEAERRHILHVMETVQGNKTVAAQVLGLDRKTLRRKLERYRRG